MSEQGSSRRRVLERIAERILAVARPHPVRVAIDGVTAAGKTTLADDLAPLIAARGRPVIRASIDDFYRPSAKRYRRGRLSPEGYFLDTFNYPAVRAALLLPLGPGGNRRYQAAVFDSWTDVPIDAPEREAPPNAILLCDGVFLFRPELDDLWDYRIFVDTDLAVAIRRGILRDQSWIDSPERARERYDRRYVPGEQLYLAAAQPQAHADLVVENTDPLNPVLVI